MTLGEAIVRGILPEPKYVIAMYSYKKELDQALTKEQQEQLAALGMIWDRNTEKWEEYFEAAQEYYRQHGNLDVMAKYVTEEDLPLGRWLSDISNKVSDENLRRVSLTDEQLERLKSIGFKQEKKTARQWNERAGKELLRNTWRSECSTVVLRKRREAGKVDIQYKVQTETSGIQRNGIKSGENQTAGQYRYELEIGREKENYLQESGMYRKKRRSWTKHVDFMLVDVLCMQLAFVISYIIRFGTDNPYTDGDYRTLAIAFLFIDFFVEIVSDSFKNVLKRGYFDEFIATCRHVILVELIVTFYLFTTQTGSFYSRFSYYIMVPFYIVTDYAARVIWKKILQKIGFNSAKKSLLIIASEKNLRETLQIVSADRCGYAKVTAVSLDTDLKGKNICGIPIVADRDGIIEYACGEWVDEVFIPPCAESEYPNELARSFLEMGIAVHTGITKFGSFPSGCQQVEKIGVYTVITTSMNYAESSKLLVKRLMDIAGGLVGCLITLLITIIVGPMIYISSPGPIFFAQERIGRNGRKFKMYKFRSMYMDAEERKKELMAQNKISDGLMFKMDFDPRIIGNKILPDGTRKTGIGEFIRKTSLDEFPQFINILLGVGGIIEPTEKKLDFTGFSLA